MQPKAAHVFRFGGVGRAPEELCEVLDPLHIVMLGLLRELADCHVLDHAPTQRACCLFGHGDAPVLSEWKPLISKQDAPSRYPDRRTAAASSLPRERFSPLAHLGGHGLWPLGPVQAIRRILPPGAIMKRPGAIPSPHDCGREPQDSIALW